MLNNEGVVCQTWSYVLQRQFCWHLNSMQIVLFDIFWERGWLDFSLLAVGLLWHHHFWLIFPLGFATWQPWASHLEVNIEAVKECKRKPAWHRAQGCHWFPGSSLTLAKLLWELLQRQPDVSIWAKQTSNWIRCSWRNSLFVKCGVFRHACCLQLFQGIGHAPFHGTLLLGKYGAFLQFCIAAKLGKKILNST